MALWQKALIGVLLYVALIIILGLPAWTLLLVVLAVVPFIQGYRSR